MPNTASWYDYGLLNIAKSVDWTQVTNPLKIALLNNLYVFDQGNHQTFADVVTFEITGTGYTARGQVLSNTNVSVDSARNVIKLTANAPSWGPGATLTTYGGVIYVDTGTNSSSVLLGYLAFSGAQTVTNGTFGLTWDPDGVLKLAAG